MALQHLKCVVVDDDRDWTELIHRYLVSSQYTVEAIKFLDALTALKYLQRESVDLVVTDMRMPEMDGLTFIEEVRELNRSTSIILVSSDESVSDEALACGANAFVRKGAINAQLSRTVDELFTSKAGGSEPANIELDAKSAQ